MLNGDNGTVKMRLTDQVVQSFHVIKEFPEISSKINAINFSTNGGLLISSDQDDQIVLYDCDIGKQKYTINSRKYGVDLIHFTPDAKNVVHSSTKVDDAIRYLSLNSKTYLHYFRGHTKKVISLCISPKKDGLSFLSGSMDNTLRLWDVRLSTCHGVMRSAGRPIAAYDPEGVIFAAGINSENIKLYDLRSFDKGPFITFHLNRERDCDWTGMKFSGDGKKILINTNGRVTRLVDAFNGTLLHTFAGELRYTHTHTLTKKSHFCSRF